MKTLIIDGHNLIPKIPGMHLSAVDDEARLMEMIQEYCRLARKKAELYFDGGQGSSANQHKSGLVHAHFTKAGSSADDAILIFLRGILKNREDFCVVSSDHRVRNAALAARIEAISSEAFSKEMRIMLSSDKAVQCVKEKKPTEVEVNEWLELFSKSSQKPKN